jgi:hypothetical protein
MEAGQRGGHQADDSGVVAVGRMRAARRPSGGDVNGAGRGVSMDDEREPNWPEWVSLSRVSVVEAVALSLDIDPHKLSTNSSAWEDDEPVYEESAEFDRRLKMAGRHTGPGAALEGRWWDNRHSVVLRDFVVWAKRVRWSMPPELAKVVDETPQPPTETVDDPRLLKTFQKMILGMAMLKYEFDPKAARSDAPGRIAAALDLRGLRVTSDTVAKRLREAAHALQDELWRAADKRQGK